MARNIPYITLLIVAVIATASALSVGDKVCVRAGLNLRTSPCGSVSYTSNGSEQGKITAVQKQTCSFGTYTWVQINLGSKTLWGAQEPGLISTCGGGSPSGGGGDVHSKVVSLAKQAAAGSALPGWQGGAIPYSWGGGHGGKPGPSYGTCSGYSGPQPCRAPQTFGLDCSGFSRWIYSMAYGRDFISGTAATQRGKGTRVSSGQPGDLVFFQNSAGHIVHVGIYIGNGQMINAPHTGAYVRQDPVSTGSTFAGYYRYQ